MAQLAEIRVADIACGSGGFLIKVLRCFWQHYQRIDRACAWVSKILKPDNGELYLAELPPNVEAAIAFRRRHNFDDHRVLIAQILLLHVFGVDKDPGALEVAKTNIWKEAVKLSPAHYNYRELKTDVVKILPNLELNFHSADSLVDVELDKQAAWLAEYHQAELRKLSELRARYIENPMEHEPLDDALALRNRLRANFIEQFQNEDLPCEPAGFALYFWPCWFSTDGKQTKTAGFDGIIGNPPWEGFKPQRKEFVAKAREHFSKYTMAGLDFTPWFQRREIPAQNGWGRVRAGAGAQAAEKVGTGSGCSIRQDRGGRCQRLEPGPTSSRRFKKCSTRCGNEPRGLRRNQAR